MTAPVILELALNGATPRSRDRHVPRTPAEIAAVAVAGIELGASIVHNHNDEPMFTTDGVHAVEPYLAAWPVLAHLSTRRWAPERGVYRCGSVGRTSSSSPGSAG